MSDDKRPMRADDLVGGLWSGGGRSAAPAVAVPAGTPAARPARTRARGVDRRVGVLRRWLAFSLDGILVMLLSLAAGLVGGAVFGDGLGALLGPSGIVGAAFVLFALLLGWPALVGAMDVAGFVLPFLGTAYTLTEALGGFSLGKLLLGLRIRNADGARAGLGQLFGRYVVKNVLYLLAMLALLSGIEVLRAVGGLGALLVWVGCLFAFGAARQALHDRAFGTAVYRKADL